MTKPEFLILIVSLLFVAASILICLYDEKIYSIKEEKYLKHKQHYNNKKRFIEEMIQINNVYNSLNYKINNEGK